MENGSIQISSGAVSRAVYIIQWAMSKYGLTPKQAAGFPGAMAASSDATLSPGFASGGRYGVAGWTPDRFTAAQASSMTLGEQLEFLAGEISKMGDKPVTELKRWQHTQACSCTVWNLIIKGDRGAYESGTAAASSLNDAYVKYADIAYDAYSKGNVSTADQESCKGMYVDTLDHETFNDPGEDGEDNYDEAKFESDPYSNLGAADTVEDDEDPVYVNPDSTVSSPLMRLYAAKSEDLASILGGSGQYLMRELGLSAVQAAGFIGCMMGESGQQLNPHAVNKAEKSGNAPNAKNRAELSLYYGRGIGQWTWKGRAVDGWDNYLKSKGLSGPKPLEASGRELQLGYVVWEVKTQRGGFLKQLKQCNNIYDATVMCVRGFENGGYNPCSLKFLDKYTWAGGAAGFRRTRGGYACTAYKYITGKTYDVPDGGAYSPDNMSSSYSGDGRGDEEVIKKLTEEEKVYNNSNVYDKNVDWADLYGKITASDEDYDSLPVISDAEANSVSDEFGDQFKKVKGPDPSEKDKESKLINDETAQQQNCETSGSFRTERDSAIQTDDQSDPLSTEDKITDNSGVYDRGVDWNELYSKPYTE